MKIEMKVPEMKAFDNLYDIDKGKDYHLSARFKHYEHKGYNQAIDECKQSAQVEVGLDREALISAISICITAFEGSVNWAGRCSPEKIADALIQNEARIIKVKGGE